MSTVLNNEPAVIAEPIAPVVVPAPVVPETPAEPLTRRDALKANFDAIKEGKETNRGKHAAFQPRQEAGKFAPGVPATPPVAAPVVPRPAMPKSYKKELEAHWNTIPPEFAAAVHQRELDSEKGILPLKAKAQEAEEILNEFKPYEMLLRMEGGTPKAAIASLLQTAAILRTGTPAQKAQSVAQVMRQFSIPLEHIQHMLSGQGAPAPDAQPNPLAQQVERLTQLVTTRQQQEQQQSEARTMTAIQAFAADPAHVHFDAVQDRMIMLLQTPQVLGVDVSAMADQDKLKLAYDTAIRLDPALHAQVIAAQQVATQTPAQVTKAKAAAVGIKGAPASGPAPTVNPNDRRALIAANLRRVT